MSLMHEEGRKKGALESLVPIVLAIAVMVSVALAFLVGILWQRVANLEGGSPKVAGTTNTGTNTAPQPASDGKLSEEAAKKIPAVTNKDHVRGNKNAEVLIVEYSDLECPFCSRFHPTAQQAVDEYDGKVAWVYRHFPLDAIHPKARPAAIAAECVSSLGGEDAFWKFVDKVFANQTTALANMAGVAKEAGVSESAFTKCTEEKKVESIVNEQYKGGSEAGVTGTPGSFIINKKTGDAWLIPGAVPFESLKVTLDSALSK